MINNKMKTVLFASLVAIMVLPVSMANAEQSLEEKQKELVERVQELDDQIAKTWNPSEREKLESERQLLLKEIMDNVSHVPTSKADVKNNANDGWTMASSQYNINITKKGCDNVNQLANIAGVMTAGSQWFTMYHYYPSIISEGSSPFCNYSNELKFVQSKSNR